MLPTWTCTEQRTVCRMIEWGSDAAMSITVRGVCPAGKAASTHKCASPCKAALAERGCLQHCTAVMLRVHVVLYPGKGTEKQVPACRYWMVPLLGVHAAGVSLPITAQGAILDSSSAFNLVTDRDFLVLEVSTGGHVVPLVAAHATRACLCFGQGHTHGPKS